MGLHCGVDLHGDNGFYAIVDEEGSRVYKKRLPNCLSTVLEALEPFRERLGAGVVVESTYNWYWLVDGLNEHGYRTRLANPAAMQQYRGLKNSDDETDAYFLTEMSRLNILPEGYIYPKEQRPVRDLLRRRLLLVQQRTQHILSFQSLITRQCGAKIATKQIRQLEPEEVRSIFDDERLIRMGQANIETMRFLDKQIQAMEKMALGACKLKPEYEKLLTVPGIGKVLALTITLESGPIDRFPKVGDYTSYCRCVSSRAMSNGKKKGENNRKNGNRYLCWAYIEASNYMRRYCPEANRWHQRKRSRSMQVVATKALAGKICKACYFIMRDQVSFDVGKIFGSASEPHRL